jgi:DNA-binding MarR family transcriptional regulator
MGALKGADELAEKILKLLPQCYNEFRSLLRDYKIEQIFMLNQLRNHGGQLERPELCTILGIDTRQAFYLIDPLRKQGLIFTERVGRIAIDKITNEGNREFEKLKDQIHSFLKSLVFEILRNNE